ncbi:family 20 glycosylhydrolase, partial [bacterium]|nr:family 20 glycosylhydrolase [bacterium]
MNTKKNNVWSTPAQDLMNQLPLQPRPQQLKYHGDSIQIPTEISITGVPKEEKSWRRTRELFQDLAELVPDIQLDFMGQSKYRIEFSETMDIENDEAYRLNISPECISIQYHSAVGAFYATHTLFQIIAFSYWGPEHTFIWEETGQKAAQRMRRIPLLEINDWPHYQNRALMVDMGRSIFSLPYLKQIVKMMAGLKLNMLHLHLHDDELNSFRYEKLPLGSENPFALCAAELKELVVFARSYHVTIVPELESWGHVQSVVYHFPELYGGPGMYGGASFQIGEQMYELLEKMYDEVVPCLEDNAQLHVGLDEAIWAVAPEEVDVGHNPTKMVRRIYEILMRVGKRHGKKITMHLWADHGGRPLPEEIQDKVVIEPWKYREMDTERIKNDVAEYGGAEKTPVMMGAGITGRCYEGHYGATRAWCQAGKKITNVLGATICLWCTNDLAGRLISLYGGGGFLWNPDLPIQNENDVFGEVLRTTMSEAMRNWQRIFPGVSPDALNQLRGPEIVMGRYVWPPLVGKAVAPTRNWHP